MAYDNGHEEKHVPCSECGRYASERYDDGWAVRPATPPKRFSDGSTGSWTCKKCVGESEDDPTKESEQTSFEEPTSGDLFG